MNSPETTHVASPSANPSGARSASSKFSRTTRYVAGLLIGAATFSLALGAFLFQAAWSTGAASDYTIQVSWPSALRSGAWPLSWRLVLSLLTVILLALFTWLIFFRVPRGIGVPLLFAQAVVAGDCGGLLGCFFILRELETYQFRMDAERLGEHWFTFEAGAVWMLAVAALGLIRIFARKQCADRL